MISKWKPGGQAGGCQVTGRGGSRRDRAQDVPGKKPCLTGAESKGTVEMRLEKEDECSVSGPPRSGLLSGDH